VKTVSDVAPVSEQMKKMLNRMSRLLCKAPVTVAGNES